MNRALESLVRGPLAITAVLVTALAILWALVAQGMTQFIVTPPDRVGQLFFGSLIAHNFQAAHGDLSRPMQAQVAVDNLRQLAERLEQAGRGIESASGESAQRQGQSATAEVKLTLADGTERTLTLTFTQENGVWRLSSLAPLEALVAAP